MAVDPSSPYTGGAIMGDRIRMMDHAADRGVFMRSMACRGGLGGLAGGDRMAAAALDAAGFDPILIETVGAGQGEVEIARLAETTVVVRGAGDGRRGAGHQGRAAGGRRRAGRQQGRPSRRRSRRPPSARHAIHRRGSRRRKPPPIMLTTATSGDGVAALADAIEAHRSTARSPEQAAARARNQVRRALADLAIEPRCAAREWEATLQSVAERELDPITAAERLLREDAGA